MLDLTIIVVTSPAPSNPSIELISQCIESCRLIEGLEDCPVIIVMDGFKVGPVDRTKMGRVTEESAARYDLYHQALLAQFSGPQYRIIRNEVHQGFALAVKVGLELCETTYCLISQHDRLFCSPFSRIGDILQAMEMNTHIRYVGFPTSSNVHHDKFISTTYNLYCLNKPEVKLSLGDHLYLQPVVFWYDSQHIGHVKRYLEIYRPYKNMPAHLRDRIGIFSIKDMLLRPGDFIEDRFGQVQRRLLWVLATRGIVTKDIMKGKEAMEPPMQTSDSDDEDKDKDKDTNEDEDNRNEHQVPTAGTSLATDTSTSITSDTPTVTSSVDTDLVVELFRWYGSYLCWQNTSLSPYDVHLACTANDTVVMVRHLRGRQLNAACITKRLAGKAAQGFLSNTSVSTSTALNDGSTTEEGAALVPTSSDCIKEETI